MVVFDVMRIELAADFYWQLAGPGKTISCEHLQWELTHLSVCVHNIFEDQTTIARTHSSSDVKNPQYMSITILLFCSGAGI